MTSIACLPGLSEVEVQRLAVQTDRIPVHVRIGEGEGAWSFWLLHTRPEPVKAPKRHWWERKS